MAMKMLYLKPAKSGLVVRDPRNGKALPDGGAAVPDTSYWRRRLRDGDVKKTTAEAVKKAAAEAAKKAAAELAKVEKGKAAPVKED